MKATNELRLKKINVDQAPWYSGALELHHSRNHVLVLEQKWIGESSGEPDEQWREVPVEDSSWRY